MQDLNNYDALLYWIKERHSIYLKKENNEPKPWTDDVILRDYRFCNPYRENDKVTKWIRKNVYDVSNFSEVWFLAVICRLLNLPESIAEVITPDFVWDKEKFRTQLKLRRNSGANLFNACYIVSTNGISMDKVDYITDLILQPMWDKKEHYRPKENDNLQSFFKRLNEARGMGKFMTAQVIADIKFIEPLSKSNDFMEFAEPGPGSLKGMRSLLGLSQDDTKCDKSWKNNLFHLRNQLNEDLPEDFPELSAQDVQNCLCEYSKFSRTKDGNGTPKQRYGGHK